MLYKFSLEHVILILLFCSLFGQNNETNTIKQSTSSSNQEFSKQIDKKRLEQINFIINSYFQNCKLDEESTVLYDCSINTINYAEFLYALFHKQLIMNFLKIYQSEGRFQQQTQIQQMYKIGQTVHQKVVLAYNEWIKIYKPNKKIPVEQMYGDIVELDSNVLDIIQHYPKKHQDFIKVLRKIYKISNLSKKYVIMGQKSEQQIADDFEGISQIYFGSCKPITNCTISLEAFVYFIKQLSFYITPLIKQLQNKQHILISQEMDFKATQFLIEKIKKLQNQLGEDVNYQQVQNYSRDLAMDLFYYLKEDDPNAKQYNDQLITLETKDKESIQKDVQKQL